MGGKEDMNRIKIDGKILEILDNIEYLEVNMYVIL